MDLNRGVPARSTRKISHGAARIRQLRLRQRQRRQIEGPASRPSEELLNTVRDRGLVHQGAFGRLEG